MAKIKILKEGETNIDSTDIWRFAFHSGYKTFKITQSGSANFTMAAGNFEAFYQINHNLGYVPMVFGWVGYGSKRYPCNGALVDQVVKFNATEYAETFAYAIADTTKVTIGVYNTLPVNATAYTNYTFTAYWRIAIDEY